MSYSLGNYFIPREKQTLNPSVRLSKLIACSRLSDSEEEGKKKARKSFLRFYFCVCAFSIQRTRLSKSLKQARCEHELDILSRCETKTFNPMRTFVSHIITVNIDLRFFPSVLSWGLSSYAFFFSKFQFALCPRVTDLSVLAQAFQTRSYTKTYILQDCGVTHVKW